MVTFDLFCAQICRSEENLSSFDFLEDNASTAIVGDWDGSVAVVDRRTPGTSSELSADIGFKRTRTVHVHPVNKQYFVAAGSVYVAQNELQLFCVFSVLSALVSEVSYKCHIWRAGAAVDEGDNLRASVYSQSCFDLFRKQVFSS